MAQKKNEKIELEKLEENQIRRFECKNEKSNKFWEISFDELDLTIKYGPIGTEGQIKLKKMSNPSAVDREVNDLIKSKLAKGYVEVNLTPKSTVENNKSTTTSPAENLWQSVRNVKVSVFNLPHQTVESLVETKKVEKDLKMVEVPNVSFSGDFVLFKLKVGSAIQALTDSFPLLKFENVATGHIVMSKKTNLEQQTMPVAQPSVVVKV